MILSKEDMRYMLDQKLVVEKPEHYNHVMMQEYITNEILKPNKQWIKNVVNGLQETEHVKLNTDDYILLPDTERLNRLGTDAVGSRSRPPSSYVTLNWLAILKDESIKTIRDLTSKHLPMLKDLQFQCLQKIQEDTGLPPDEIMVYVHYHPSVYQLHIHFAYPYMQYNHKDIYRIHSLGSIINNLSMHDTYYKEAHLQISVHKDSPIFKHISDLEKLAKT